MFDGRLVCIYREEHRFRGGEGRKSWKEIGGRREGGEKCVSGLKRGRKLDKMDDNRHFDSGGTQPSSKCMQRDLHLDALSIKSRVIRDHLGQEAHRSLTNERTNERYRYQYLMPPFNRFYQPRKLWKLVHVVSFTFIYFTLKIRQGT